MADESNETGPVDRRRFFRQLFLRASDTLGEAARTVNEASESLRQETSADMAEPFWEVDEEEEVQGPPVPPDLEEYLAQEHYRYEVDEEDLDEDLEDDDPDHPPEVEEGPPEGTIPRGEDPDAHHPRADEEDPE